ncbi:MAG TPA: oxidoreductase [Thermoleophilaceae bacterium]|nr:oxidoreductase [Thermoleophilaceae bacterium]
MSEKWNTDRIPDQTGRTAVVTGANSGLGLHCARELARAGAHVVMACRNLEKGELALQEVEAGGSAELAPLDLGSLASVREFSAKLHEAHGGIDLLVNNAGVMAPPRRETADGFELQFGTNHLGHFALTGLLLDMLEGREDARVVTVSSTAARTGRLDFDNLQRERRYFRWTAYGQSKLANLVFTIELERRLSAAGSTVKSMGAHPGYAATNLQSAAAPLLDRIVMKVGNAVAAQSAEMGTLPLLYAATEPGLPGGSYAGPDSLGEQRGHPMIVTPVAAARDEETGRRLWEASESLTGVAFGLPAPV